jgi:stearoyl-CoA desaturase (Delta-9 desaturase)
MKEAELVDIQTREATPKIIWENIAFFAATTLVGVLGGLIYIFSHGGVKPFYLVFTLLYAFATGVSISAGYHRLFSHVTYKANPIVEFFFLFFGAAAFEQSALRWSSQHRDHHNFVASEDDPYSIHKGFFYAHIGWLCFVKHRLNYGNAPDLSSNKLVENQHKYYRFWALGAGILLPLLIGILYDGDWLAALIFPVCLRIVIVHQATFCVNSVCHTFGSENYDLTSTARDNWLVALVTNGEGFHNYHHRFPSDFRNGIHWYQWDPAKWLISTLSYFNLAHDLKKMSKFGILLAQLKTNQEKFRIEFSEAKKASRLEQYYSDPERSYKDLRARLLDWEKKSKEYGNLIHHATEAFTHAVLHAAKQRMHAAKLRYKHGHRQRKKFTPPPSA